MRISLAPPALVLLCAVACGDEPPCAEELIEEHRGELQACEPGDTCVLLPEHNCLETFNEEKRGLYEELIERGRSTGCDVTDCFGETSNPRCEDGRCVVDREGRADAGR